MSETRPLLEQRRRIESRLQEYDQTHLLRFWDELDGSQQQQLLSQLEAIDFDQLQQLRQEVQGECDWQQLASKAETPPAYRLTDAGHKENVLRALKVADEQLSQGKVGVVVVAGGQGSRLGFPHPKGMYRIGPVSGRSLFQMHIEQILAISRRYGVRVPLYMMTSPATHEETIEFLTANDRFGLAADDLKVFCQGVMPAVDEKGRLLLEQKDSVFVSPDGHGGMLKAFLESGCLADAESRGLEQLYYFQVDNPLVHISDRELLGCHVLSQSEMSTQVVAKQQPDDKVGNVVSIDGRLTVIEYSDLPRAAAEARNGDGSLKLWAGSIAVHVFDVRFLRRVSDAKDSLPFHRARKKIGYVNADGEFVEPDQPNGTKFERFIFDLMPLANNAIVVEADESEVFAPLKNASGAAKDTPEATRDAIIARARRWLAEAGVEVAAGCRVEISPFVALESLDLRDRFSPGTCLDRDTYLS